MAQAEKPETVGQGSTGIEGWRCFKDVVGAVDLCHADDLNSLK